MIDPGGYLENHTGREYESVMNKKAEKSSQLCDLESRSVSSIHHSDFKKDISEAPLDHGGEPRWTEYNDIDPKENESLSDHQLFLLPQHTLGFKLDTKEWSLSLLFLAHDLLLKPDRHP